MNRTGLLPTAAGKGLLAASALAASVLAVAVAAAQDGPASGHPGYGAAGYGPTGYGPTGYGPTGYGHVRTLEGSAALTRADTGEREDLALNYPLQVGDSLETASGAAVEMVLADFNILRVGGGARIGFPQLARSADADDRRTVLTLDRGEIQLLVTEHALGDELPAVETPSGAVRIHEPGTYVVSVDASGGTRVVVRGGYAEVAAAVGSRTVASGQELWVDASGSRLAGAAGRSDLERWGEALSAGALSVPEEVAPELGYSASALAESGEWVEAEGARAWRPFVPRGWRPYAEGFWVTTPSGLTWVGLERWSWLTAHYGQWVPHPSWGWVWYPGYLYSPAQVYWYWGPGWVGWVPGGYYGLSAAGGDFYGYAGGPWSYYRDWTFCPAGYIGTRDGSRHHYPGWEMPARSGRPAVPRGVVATETRGIRRVGWDDPAAAARELLARGDTQGPRRDYTEFVAGRTARPRGSGDDQGTVERAVPRSLFEPAAYGREWTYEIHRRDPERRSLDLDGWPSPTRGAPAVPGSEAREADSDAPVEHLVEPPVRRVVERLRSLRAEREERVRSGAEAEPRASSGRGRTDDPSARARSASGRESGSGSAGSARPTRPRDRGDN
jgi:hypothetical protein